MINVFMKMRFVVSAVGGCSLATILGSYDGMPNF